MNAAAESTWAAPEESGTPTELGKRGLEPAPHRPLDFPVARINQQEPVSTAPRHRHRDSYGE